MACRDSAALRLCDGRAHGSVDASRRRSRWPVAGPPGVLLLEFDSSAGRDRRTPAACSRAGGGGSAADGSAPRHGWCGALGSGDRHQSGVHIRTSEALAPGAVRRSGPAALGNDRTGCRQACGRHDPWGEGRGRVGTGDRRPDRRTDCGVVRRDHHPGIDGGDDALQPPDHERYRSDAYCGGLWSSGRGGLRANGLADHRSVWAGRGHRTGTSGLRSLSVAGMSHRSSLYDGRDG